MRSTWQSWLFALLITFTLGFGSGYSLHWALSTPPVVPNASVRANVGQAGSDSLDGQKTAAPLSVGTHLFIAVDGHWLNDQTRALLEEIQPGGIVLRAQNLRTAAQVLSLVREIKETRTDGAPRFSDLPFIALAPDVDAAAAFGIAEVNRPRLVRAADQTAARQLGRDLALAAADRGINLLLGPILETHTRDTAYPDIANAAYDIDPVLVAAYGLEEATGMLEAGVLSVPAYFPGYTSTQRTNRDALPVLHQDYAGLAQRMFPFNEAVSAGVHGLVIAHVSVPTLEPEAPVRPASQSPKVLGEIVRGLWGFDGVLLADDIGGARVNLPDPAAAAVASLAAGCDAVLMLDPNPDHIRDVAHALQAAVDTGEISPATLEQSRDRLARWQEWLEGPLPGGAVAPGGATQMARTPARQPDVPVEQQATSLIDDGDWEPADPASAPESAYSPWPDETPAWRDPAPESAAGPSEAPPPDNSSAQNEVALLPNTDAPPATSADQDLAATETDTPTSRVDAGQASASIETTVAETGSVSPEDAPDETPGRPTTDDENQVATAIDSAKTKSGAEGAAEERDEPVEPVAANTATTPDDDETVATAVVDAATDAEPEFRIVSHPVQPGEGLEVIAERYDVAPAKLKTWNHLDDQALDVGQTLEVRLSPERAEEVLAEREESPLPEYETIAYKVAAGDTLTAIARNHSVSVEDIVKWNELSSREIRSGRTLTIYRPADAPPIIQESTEPPDDESAAPAAEAGQAESVQAEAPPAPAPAIASTYTVQAGDTLTRISGLHGVTPDAIMKRNNISNPNQIFVGQKLQIPE